jgi:hypothetical protein
MTEERTFLQQGSVYVSNTRVVINGTTYATANVTSVRTLTEPANNGCAATILAIGFLGTLGSIPMMVVSRDSDSGFLFAMSLILAALGYIWYRSIRPVYRVMLASAGGERQGLSSSDPALVTRTTAAIAEAIIYRG